MTSSCERPWLWKLSKGLSLSGRKRTLLNDQIYGVDADLLAGVLGLVCQLPLRTVDALHVDAA